MLGLPGAVFGQSMRDPPKMPINVQIRGVVEKFAPYAPYRIQMQGAAQPAWILAVPYAP